MKKLIYKYVLQSPSKFIKNYLFLITILKFFIRIIFKWFKRLARKRVLDDVF